MCKTVRQIVTATQCVNKYSFNKRRKKCSSNTVNVRVPFFPSSSSYFHSQSFPRFTDFLLFTQDEKYLISALGFEKEASSVKSFDYLCNYFHSNYDMYVHFMHMQLFVCYNK